MQSGVSFKTYLTNLTQLHDHHNQYYQKHCILVYQFYYLVNLSFNHGNTAILKTFVFQIVRYYKKRYYKVVISKSIGCIILFF